MKYYKTEEHFKRALIRNNGKQVTSWSDKGISIKGKRYKLIAYGDIKGKANSYVIFRNENLDENIEVHYNLLKAGVESKTSNIFEFVEMW